MKKKKLHTLSDASSRHGQRTEEIISRLTDEILYGPLSSGDRLGEQELSMRFGTSRGPVREALRKLEMRGLVVFTPNVGARVAFYMLSDFVNLLLAREAMEGMAARLAAVSMTDEEKVELRQRLNVHEEEIRTRPAGDSFQTDTDLDFHRCIIHGSRHPILFHILCEDLYPLSRLCRRLHRSVPGRGRRATVEHSRVLEAIEEGDEEMAELTMRRHIIAARKCLESIFNPEDAESLDPDLLKSRPSFLNWDTLTFRKT
jgi:DNA-binding GntR family transcriptional regulator